MTELEKLLEDLSSDATFRLEDFKLFLGDSKDASVEQRMPLWRHAAAILGDIQKRFHGRSSRQP